MPPNDHESLQEVETMLMRFDPFHEFDRLTDQVFGGRSVMAMDAYRQGGEFVVHFDLPGVDADSIDLTVEGNVLTVTAKRERQHGDGVDVIASERPYGTFTRQLFLGDGLDAEHLDARYAHGVLSVRVPVAEQAKPRKVEISSGGAAKENEASSTAA
jgi:HSP20 family protein